MEQKNSNLSENKVQNEVSPSSGDSNLSDIACMNLFEKMQLVSLKIKNIEKNIEVGTGSSKYKATSDYDVVTAVKKAEAEYRIISIPQNVELLSSEVVKSAPDKNGYVKITYVDNVRLTTLFVNLDNPTERIEVTSLGKGVDTGDKGFGKASTYARKYALLNAYKIATGEDPDKEPSQNLTTENEMSKKEKAVREFFANNNDKLAQMLSYFAANSLDDLSETQMDIVYKTYKQRDLL